MAANVKVYRSELTPVSFLERSALVFPDKVAVVHGERRYTYRQFAERVWRLANQLRAAGLRKHDRVAFLSPNAPALLEAHFGVPAAGGILVAINTRLTSREIDYILKHSGSRFLFVDAELLPLVESLELPGVEQVRIDDTGRPDDPYEQFLAAGSPEPPASWLEDEEETISINYTSGTTGNPKGVMYTYRGAYLNALGEVIETGMSSSSVYLWTLPMFHCNGWCFPWAVTAVGGRHVCLRKVDPGLVWDLLEQEGVTHYNGAPTVHIFIVNHPKAHRIERGVTVTVAGAPPSPTLLAQMRRLNMRPIHVYGLTETYGPYTVCEWHEEWSALPEEEQARLLARQGQGYVVAERARVVDDEMRDVPWDGQTMGEVLMRGNNVAKGYYENPEATEKAFAGGWFHSGDIAVWHPDGYIELRDRAKDIIISGGENISTIEVEQVVARHPAVLECAVIGIPDPTWGERPKAFVTLKPGQRATEQEIIEFCRQHLAHFKCPVAVSFGELPKTSTGKIQKFVLREREWAGREKRIN
ncbi:acyl--CoA ligase family protein [Thermogemmatispora sp.]|uniref:acyl--CoA ligase family protein n=1 Tax=Thermogemmatispora sp. TaxID=1968838 RepID=UPI0035E42CC1